MNTLVLANFPLAVLVILAIVGIPLWMTFKRPETAPDYSEARAYFGAKASRVRALAAVGEPVRAGLTPARAGLTSAGQHTATHAARAAQPTRAAA